MTGLWHEKAISYDDKQPSYFDASREDLIELVPRRADNVVLEIGAGTGATLLTLKARGLASYVIGVDLQQIPGSTQRNPALDHFVVGNVETMDLDLPTEHFDVILCADVLEHLVDPWVAVKRLSGYLKPGGLFISSIPNIRNYRAMRSVLLHGRFAYEDGGIMDRTHLRFFCRDDIRALFTGAGLRIVEMRENMGGYGRKHRLVDRLTLGSLHDLFVFQYRTVARKA